MSICRYIVGTSSCEQGECEPCDSCRHLYIEVTNTNHAMRINYVVEEVRTGGNSANGGAGGVGGSGASGTATESLLGLQVSTTAASSTDTATSKASSTIPTAEDRIAAIQDRMNEQLSGFRH